MSPFITLLTAIKKLLAFKVDRDEFRDVVKETKRDIEGIKNAIPTDEDILKELIERDMLLAVHDEDNAILTDENGNVILRY